jgi:hypothetical protein
LEGLEKVEAQMALELRGQQIVALAVAVRVLAAWQAVKLALVVVLADISM